ncbi:DUF4111 domain-containing protein [Bacillus sp. ISL-47]|uniref:aminoglycoside adenylyltransferase domain-containing protein n=1 Tax=Bacillus sp. ISL-47 TaxID=2819130 RepID=UPI001BE56F44|nr:aminoglycoside adenylyltransferase domain-containing protein [Bacillus sp. ISL-47]MBT2687225.1 DUF4111 domain-containing protein [Bacillus sp. ISL-47]
MTKIPKMVEEILNEYINLLNGRLPKKLEGLYLHGSIALEAYVEGSSDIDFVAVTRNCLSEAETKGIAEIHRIIAEKFEQPKMDGVYVTLDEIGKLSESYFYNNGKLGYGHFLTPVTWSLLKKKGIVFYGPEPAFEINENDLMAYSYENMNTYWVSRIQKIEKSIDEVKFMPARVIDEEIEWTVLGLLRQFYTLRENDIISKLGAGEYALGHLPEKWHPIIKEAMNIRKGIKSGIFESEEERIKETIRLSKYIFSQSAAIII